MTEAVRVTPEMQELWATLSNSEKAWVLLGPPVGASDAMIREAGQARELHEALEFYGGDLDLAAESAKLSPEFVAMARTLLRRYPTAAEAVHTMRVIFDVALTDMLIAKLEREMEKAETPAAVRRIARDIDQLRAEAKNAGGHVHHGGDGARDAGGEAPDPDGRRVAQEGPPPTLWGNTPV